MSNQPDDSNDRDEDDEERAADSFGIQLGGRIGKLLDFLDEQASRERGTPGGSRPGRIGIEYDLSASTGLGESDRRPTGRRRIRRTRTPSSKYLATIREADGDVVITADLPGVDADDVSAGIADDVFVVRVDSEEVARVPVHADAVEAIEATFNNYVLNVRIPGSVLDGTPEEVVSG